MTLNDYYELVEGCIKSLGVDPTACRGKNQGSWILHKGSAKVYIDVWHIERENRPYFQVMSPVSPIPTANKEAFYKELLLLNSQMYGVGFVLFNDWAWIKLIRECDGLDSKEALATMHRVGNYSDRYDDQLKEKFFNGPGGGPPGGGTAPK